jgi:hypothetical protein
MSSSLVILFGLVKQFGWFWIRSETECKIPAEYGQQHCLYVLYIKFGKGRGATVHKYRSIVHGMGASSQAGSKIPMNLSPVYKIG